MSISSALSNALSGLTAASRSADVAASNIANAMTEGYGVRQAILTPRAYGSEGGVRVTGIQRLVDQVLISDRRQAGGALAGSQVEQDFFGKIQLAAGLPNESGSLGDLLSKLEASLSQATSQPESEPLLLQVLENLTNLATHVNGVADAVQTERERADAEIATSVETLNATLVQIDDLNDDIRRHLVLDHDVSALIDQRQALVDSVSELIPVREIDRGNGDIALMTAGGVMLLDGRPAVIGFTNSAVITPNMTLAAGTLSGLTIDGRTVNLQKDPSPIAGGRLDALFVVRDDYAVEMQAKLDGYARDLIERFEDPAVDTTRASTDPGLFTDAGSVFDPLYETGLAQRISVNALADPDNGGAVWRLRDGLNAASPGDEGDAALLIRLGDALSAYAAPSSSAFSGGVRTASTLASDILSHVGGALNRADTAATFAQSQYDTLKELELADGVDTDAEMQKLLLIEQAYSANARVVQVIDDMLDWLMRI